MSAGAGAGASASVDGGRAAVAPGRESAGVEGAVAGGAVPAPPAVLPSDAPVRDDAWLVALDVDGTIMTEGGDISDAVTEQIRRLHDEGHQVMIATGRSVATTLPVMEKLGLQSDYVVCSNGAMTLGRTGSTEWSDTSDAGYSTVFVEEFDPSEVLSTIAGRLDSASYAVEDSHGNMLYLGDFPTVALSTKSHEATFDELCGVKATRVVVMSPSHSLDEFLEIVESMGLHKVSYNVGWTAWLDIAPFGVTKATAMERVRQWLDIPRERVMACGDGRNDIDMLAWAGESGRGVAMGQAPEDVLVAASERTGSDVEDGLAAALSTL